MKKIKSIDNHKIRIKAQEINTPIIEFIFQKLEKLSKTPPLSSSLSN